ncbi:MAG: DUF2264 domain-containing protein [Clostridiales bacterium]|nr:DUF2264 domain-containing protein [Clostridiales bacterium]
MAFTVTKTDYKLSPYTGMTREAWLEAAKYLLENVFSNIKNFTDPVVVPRTETEITYPHKNASEETLAIEQSAERFEGLTRSLFIAAPLIHNLPEITVCGYKLRDYYKAQILRSCTRGDEYYVGNYEDMQEKTHRADPTRCFQQTVETCALVIGLWVSKKEIWNTYTKAEKDTIAAFLSSYAHQHTVPQNWRLFNMLDLAFLHMEGYPIDEDIMLDHASSILAYYAGDGWYRDGQSFDYYSCWAFQFYAPLWNVWYGYEHLPKIAQKFEEHSNELMKTYPDFFDEDGFTNMWGRSNIYRFASVSAFDGNMLLKNPAVNYGLARRIASGSLLQFLSREDFIVGGVPTLGFYRQFSPLVQGYSCAESVLWCGKAFLFLHLPEDHPFWTETENNGSWEKLGAHETKNTVLDGPALSFSNHKANGTTFLRTGKVLKDKNDFHGMWNYSKLCYATKYPWESAPSSDVESQQYIIKDEVKGNIERANATLWCGEKDGVLYRKQFFGFDLQHELHWMQAINLADFPVPFGIFRADKLSLFHRPVTITLGSFGFPDNGVQITHKEKDGAEAIILKGCDACGRKKQLAFTICGGWDKIDFIKSTGTNPDSEHSIVVFATARRVKQYGYENYLLLSQTLTRESHEDFTDEELFPLLRLQAKDEKNYSAYGKTVLHFRDGAQKTLDFSHVQGKLLL